jgi:ribosomal protein S18 acetylase RimI-like enzyme
VSKESVEIRRDVRAPERVGEILRALPDWFGIEDAVLDYIEQSRVLPSHAALVEEQIVGICLTKHHSESSVEIYLMAVDPRWRRRGIGRALLDAAEKDLASNGIEFLQVKTLGPSEPWPPYDETRKFYEALGFRQLEEIHGLWPDNPCLILVKHLPSTKAK